MIYHIKFLNNLKLFLLFFVLFFASASALFISQNASNVFSNGAFNLTTTNYSQSVYALYNSTSLTYDGNGTYYGPMVNLYNYTGMSEQYFLNSVYWNWYEPTSSYVNSITNVTSFVITLNNSQTTSTPAYFQQLLTINSSQFSNYINANWSNVVFSTGPLDTGLNITAWIESGNTNTSTSTYVWIADPYSIGASSNQTIYMNFVNYSVLSSNGPTGEAPNLSPSYGQYDDGALIFLNYFNFNGTTIPSGVSVASDASNGTIVFNNSAKVEANNTDGTNGEFLFINNTYSPSSYIIDSFFENGSENTNDKLNGWDEVIPTNQSGWWGWPKGVTSGFHNQPETVTILNTSATTYQTYQSSNGVNQVISPTVVSTDWFSPTTTSAIFNYSIFANSSTDIPPMINSYPVLGYTSNGAFVTLSWARMRLTPPNNVMPFVTVSTNPMNSIYASLILDLPLENDFRDISTNNVTVTPSSPSPSFQSNCQIGSCATFNGVNESLSLPVGFLNNDLQFTISMWVKTNSSAFSNTLGDFPTFFGLTNAGFGTGSLQLGINNSYLTVSSGLMPRISFYYQTNSYLADNNWHQVLFVDNGSNYSLYLDNNLSTTFISNITFNSSTFGPYLGADDNLGTASYFYNGSIDEVHVWNQALNSTEISALYTSEGQGHFIHNFTNVTISVRVKPDTFNESGLIGWWDLGNSLANETVSNESLDLSGYNNPLLFYNSPSVSTNGIIGNSLEFNGTNYLEPEKNINFNPSISNFTILVWVNPNSSGTILSSLDNSGTGVTYLGIDNSSICGAGTAFYTSLNGTPLCTDYNITPNQWYQLGVERNGNNIFLIINGTFENISTTTPSSDLGNFIIGENKTFGQGFSGYLSDLMIFNRSLNTSYIYPFYHNGNPTSLGGLESNWTNWTKINSGQNLTLNDTGLVQYQATFRSINSNYSAFLDNVSFQFNLLPNQTYQMPIYVLNRQSTATGNNYQQLIQLNFSQFTPYLNSNYGNIRFCLDTNCSILLNSWLENPGSINQNATIWVNLTDGINGNSFYPIYFTIFNPQLNFDGYYWGEAPDLTNPYGIYDNGQNVFVNYGGGGNNVWNEFSFEGGSWDYNNGYLEQTLSSGSYTGGPAAYITSTQYAANGSYVLTESFNYSDASNARVGIIADGTYTGNDMYAYRFIGETHANSNGFVSFLNDEVAWVANGNYTGSSLNTPYTLNVSDNGGIWSSNLYAGSDNETSTSIANLTNVNYSSPNGMSATTGYVGISAAYMANSVTPVSAIPINVNWFYVRLLAPNDTMPYQAVNVTSLSTSLISPTSGNASAYGQSTNLVFSVSTPEFNLVNASLYTNFTNGWSINQTIYNVTLNSAVQNLSYNFSNLPVGTYVWNVFVNDGNSSTWANNGNYTFTISSSNSNSTTAQINGVPQPPYWYDPSLYPLYPSNTQAPGVVTTTTLVPVAPQVQSYTGISNITDFVNIGYSRNFNYQSYFSPNDTGTLNILISGNGSKLIALDNSTLEVSSDGGYSQINYTIFTNSQTLPGLYVANLSIMNVKGRLINSIPVYIDVLLAQQKLMDISLTTLSSTIKSYSPISYSLDLKNVGQQSKYDVDILLTLLDSNGNTVQSQQYTVSMISELNLTNEFNITKAISDGTYQLIANASYFDPATSQFRYAESSVQLNKLTPSNFLLSENFVVGLIIILVVCLAIVFRPKDKKIKQKHLN